MSWRSSRPFVTRVSAGFGWLLTTPSPRNAEACSYGDTSEKIIRRAAGRATVAVPTALRPHMRARLEMHALETHGPAMTGHRLLAGVPNDDQAAGPSGGCSPQVRAGPPPAVPSNLAKYQWKDTVNLVSFWPGA